MAVGKVQVYLLSLTQNGSFGSRAILGVLLLNPIVGNPNKIMA